MAASLRVVPARAAAPARAPGSIFAKGLRDSRRGILLAGVGCGLFVLFYAASVAMNYGTAAGRHDAVAAALAVESMAAMTGPAINPETLGGFLSWRCVNLLPLVLGVWSIVALSGTLAAEIRGGSFELLGTLPITRRRIALEKVAVHLAGLAVAALLMAALFWLAGVVFARLPGDGIAFSDALAQSLGVALAGLVGGAIAFALVPFVGRAAGAGIAAVVLFGAYFVDTYSAIVPAFAAVHHASWFSWMANERPIAGRSDPISLLPVAAVAAALLALGVVAFVRRDPGVTLALPAPRLPGRRFLLRGPAREAFLETRTAALAWGLAIGLYAWLMALSAKDYIDELTRDASSASMVARFFPDVDWHTTGGMLQLLFFGIGAPFVAFAAATLVGSIAGQEHERRLELLLTTPVARARWFVATGSGAYASVGLLTLVLALAVWLGTAGAGGDAAQPFAGAWVAGLYAAALAGVGLALFGLGRPGLAGPAIAALAVAFVLLDVLGSSMKLPSDVLALSVTRHLGQPMAGVYDPGGMAAAAAIAVGGLLLGAWGLRRRDVAA